MVNFPADVPTLSDDVVTLRAHHPGDADRIIEFANDERSRRFIPLPDPYGPQQAQEFLDSVAINWLPIRCTRVGDRGGRAVRRRDQPAPSGLADVGGRLLDAP